MNDIKQHTQFIINEILAIKLPAEATVVSSKVSKSVPKVSELGKKECKREARKDKKELPNTGSNGTDLPIKEIALIGGAALLARRRNNQEKQS